MKIGGLAGLGTTTASASISIDRNLFCIGDKANVRVDMDNSDCAKPVKSFKFKLRRRITANAGLKTKSQPQMVKEEYVVEISCGALQPKL